MAIPDFQSIMLPLLRLTADGKEHSIREAIEALAGDFRLTDAEKTELLPSGTQRVFDNRVSWARSYLTKAALLEVTRRGHFCITQRGREVLSQKPSGINLGLLEQFPEFRESRPRRRKSKETPGTTDAYTRQTPDEILEGAYQTLRENLTADLRTRIGKCSPGFFEKLVIDVLVAMGYGGSEREAAKAVGRPGDEGIDGLINEDRLGLDVIYVQAKRWDKTVGRPEVQRFAGALQGHHAKKGILITASEFSPDAKQYVEKIEPKIVLIDGKELARLMFDYNVGVSKERSYETKKIDNDYFDEA